MTDQSPGSNRFRAAVLRGEKRPLLVAEKQPRLAGATDDLDRVLVPRSEQRRSNHRDQDRHRLSGETATARYERRKYEVELINLSAGGAMIRAEFAPRLWEMIELELGEGSSIEGAVRWVKGGRIGLEFAHETRIDCAPEARAELLLEVIQRSFPDLDVELEVPEGPRDESPSAAESKSDLGNRGEVRHPLVWSGQILFAFDSSPVRLRNISSGGALVDVAMIYPVGSEVMLDLGAAGQLDATVSWAHAEQVGLRFKQPFDIAKLANLRPDVTPHHWQRPGFLEASERQDSSPWDDEWQRTPIAQLREQLEGFLKY